MVAPAPARPAPPTRPAPRRPVPAQSAPALPAPELPAPELPVPSILVPSLPASDLSAPATAPGRRVVVGQFDASHCRDNCVITSKFTVVNFLPLALFSEFRRAANGYYLFIGFLMPPRPRRKKVGSVPVVVGVCLSSEGRLSLSLSLSALVFSASREMTTRDFAPEISGG